MKIGHTSDGMVFALIQSEYDGKAVHTIEQLTPDSAREAARSFEEAAVMAEKMREQNERDRANPC